MPRRTREAKLETRSARLRLPVAKKPVFVKIGRGVGLGYRRNMTSGTWVVRITRGGVDWAKAIGAADDFDNADGTTVLDFWQAQDWARAAASEGRARDGSDDRPLTISGALDRYTADLKIREGDTANVARVRKHLSAGLAAKSIILVTARDLLAWRDSLGKELAPATINRTANSLKAALNLAADHDERITSRRAWQVGLASLRGAEETRNVILADAVIRTIINAAYEENTELGLLVEVAAVTGARTSQIARLDVQDLQDSRIDPRLMMPRSRKGREKKITRRPVPIPPSLAAKLRDSVGGRQLDAPLLSTPVKRRNPSSKSLRWGRSDHSKLFARAVRAAGLDPNKVTIYALRHSNIVRQLLAGVPVRVVAVNHDTSVVMIERTYSRYIGDHADALARKALLDLGAPAAGNVVPLVTTR
jgi:integrase